MAIKFVVAPAVQPFTVTSYCMVLVPALIKITFPVLTSTVATEVLEELQIPFGVLFVKLMELPTQPPIGPAIGETTGGSFTITLVLKLPEHPLLSVTETV